MRLQSSGLQPHDKARNYRCKEKPAKSAVILALSDPHVRGRPINKGFCARALIARCSEASMGLDFELLAQLCFKYLCSVRMLTKELSCILSALSNALPFVAKP